MASLVIEQNDNSYIEIPSVIVDKYLCKACYDDIKVYLYIVRNPGKSCSFEDLSEIIGVDAEQIKKSISFWISEKMLIKKGERISLVPQGFSSSGKYTYTGDIIAEKLKANKNYANLIEKIEKLLLKPLSYADTGVILNLCDWLGIPESVIENSAVYCLECGKQSLGYIEKTAISWYESGISDEKSAKAHLEALRNKKTLESRYASLIGALGRSLTESEKKYVSVWCMDFGYDMEMIGKAYEICIDKTGKYSASYMNSILRNWHEKGYKNVSETEAEEKPEKAKQKRKNTSYDLEKSFKTAWEIVHNGEEE